jgi:hypothetical protein
MPNALNDLLKATSRSFYLMLLKRHLENLRTYLRHHVTNSGI